MVYRIYVEKKNGLAHEAAGLYRELTEMLGITTLEGVRLFNRYDVENIDKELFDYSVNTVFSEPQLDNVTYSIDNDGATVFAVEYLPGQFDQRADSAAQCIQLISQKERPVVRTAKVYCLYGAISAEQLAAIKKYVINPVESREASLDEVKTLVAEYDIPTSVETLNGFIALDDSGLEKLMNELGLAMDLDDIRFCRDYFSSEKRDPTITEIRMIDTYWSDHCRHTTFLTTVDSVSFEDEEIEAAYNEYIKVREELGRTKPVNLMDIGTIAAKYLKKNGMLAKLDESEEINACTVKIKVTVNGVEEDWLLLFKNETHNHPTEIEPFGGAATCIGGAIRDPLSGRSYVYGAMRVTGAADPRKPISETMPGKLPQRKIVSTAAAGYSSYGNQIGLATGVVDELYHDGYVAKRMEIGAVIAAAPEKNVRREVPADGDIIVLLGGRTGRDGCGGATGSSKSHTLDSLQSCGAEVQKGNAPEERKLQRLFRNGEATRLIKRCNDFGAGGVSVAIGELADGIEIDLNAVPKKYEGLDGTELAISESQERMAVVVEAKDVERFKELAELENLEATVVARVTELPRLVMRWNGNIIVDISREFLNSNGAEKHISVAVSAPQSFEKKIDGDFKSLMSDLASDLNVCSKRGLSERFDSTIGAGSVLMPFGGKNQSTPTLVMVNNLSVEKADTDTCSFMSWGYNPFISEKSPYHGAYLAVVESASKLIAGGADFNDTYLTFQEYFEKPRKEAARWGKPFSALLGAFKAQKDLGIAAIGGKDSMSGSFENIDVPPTLVSFAVAPGDSGEVISPEFKAAGNKLCLLKADAFDAETIKANLSKLYEAIKAGKVLSAWALGLGGVAEGALKMALGNRIGAKLENIADPFCQDFGSVMLEMADGEVLGDVIGATNEEYALCFGGECVQLDEIQNVFESKL
ncbi:MAG: phosphoribosylformylglycinamidine synthase, partial [Clostridia bacterium]|nr:phosphoribosylformylglycinamidine synthase [Clostridia bacterium]